jgi:hypothetical protein
LKASLVHPTEIPLVWEQVEPLLAKVTEHTEGEITTEDYIEPLSLGEMQLWIAVKDEELHSVMVTQIIPYPQKRILRILAIAGSEFKALYKFKDMVESFAIRSGCSALELWGRKGWKKLLPDWKDSYIVYTKDLKQRMQ